MALEIAPGKTRIGWIGTGVMGSSMCGHLMAAGYQATVYNRSRSKVEAAGGPRRDRGRLAQAGRRGVRRRLHDRRLPRATSARSPSGRRGPWPAPRPGRVLVDMTTSEPALAREIFEAAKAKGVHAVDAPGLRRRRRGARGPALDHDRRRGRGRRARSIPCSS